MTGASCRAGDGRRTPNAAGEEDPPRPFVRGRAAERRPAPPSRYSRID